MLEDVGTPRPLAFALHIKNIFKERKKNSRKMSRLVHYYLFSKARGKMLLWQQAKIFCHSPPSMLFLLNIKKIFIKSNTFAKN